MQKKLLRSRNKMVCGLCAGVAEYFNVDPTVIRAGYALLCFITGLLPCILAYVVLCFIIPEK